MATTLSAPLPEMDWKDLSFITVDSGNASALITELVIHLRQDIEESREDLPDFTPTYLPTPTGTEAPGLTRG